MAEQFKLEGEDVPKDSTGNVSSVVITFDDGYRHLAQTLPRLIEIYNFKPIVFIPTAFIGKSNTWDYTHYFVKEPHVDRPEIRMLSESGVIFGSHSHSHVDLSRLSDRRLLIELRQSKEILQDILRKEVTVISYPFGRASEEVLQAAKESGFRRGYTMRFPLTDDNPLAAGRIAIYGFDTTLSISKKLSGSGMFYRLEKVKSSVSNSLSGGTLLLNRMRRIS